jgi:hypothetical protein
MNNTVPFKIFLIIIIHYYKLKNVFQVIMHKHMKITHHAHRDKWGYPINLVVSVAPQSHLSLTTLQVVWTLSFGVRKD